MAAEWHRLNVKNTAQACAERSLCDDVTRKDEKPLTPSLSAVKGRAALRRLLESLPGPGLFTSGSVMTGACSWLLAASAALPAHFVISTTCP